MTEVEIVIHYVLWIGDKVIDGSFDTFDEALAFAKDHKETCDMCRHRATTIERETKTMQREIIYEGNHD